MSFDELIEFQNRSNHVLCITTALKCWEIKHYSSLEEYKKFVYNNVNLTKVCLLYVLDINSYKVKFIYKIDLFRWKGDIY